MRCTRWFPLLAVVLAAGIMIAPALAQEKWPARTVRFVVTFGPGGGADNTARPYVDHLSRAFGQQFVIENRPGASGAIGAEVVVRAAPDGYTFLVGAAPTLTVIPQARTLGWDVFRDLTPVGRLADYSMPITIAPSLPVRSLAELKAYSQANPGKLNCGSAGLGTFTHLICEQLRTVGGIDVLHVPYRGGTDSLNDFLAGVTQIHAEPNIMPYVKAGRARLLAIADRERHPDYPDVPLISEIYPEFALVGWYALFAPAGTPAAIIERLNAEINRIARLPEIKTQFLSLGLRPGTGSPDDFAALHKADWEYYGKMVRAMHLKLE
jgi:tripartite-type tricarboxylate transporter receptor subunit TctC